MDWSNIILLAFDSKEQILFYLESLKIFKHKPPLTRMQTSVNNNNNLYSSFIRGQ